MCSLLAIWQVGPWFRCKNWVVRQRLPRGVYMFLAIRSSSNEWIWTHSYATWCLLWYLDWFQWEFIFFIIYGNLLFSGWIAETPASSYTAWAWKLLTFAIFHEQRAQLFGWTHHRKRLFIFLLFLNYFLLFSHQFCMSASLFLIHTCVHSQNEIYVFHCDQFDTTV